MKQAAQRPVFLNLLQIRLPIGGVLSILHRISGVVLVLAIPAFVYYLQLLGSGPQGFEQAQSHLQSISGKILVSLIMWLLIQHSLSGIRHLMMDMDFGYDKLLARKTATLAFFLSFALIILTGLLIWL